MPGGALDRAPGTAPSPAATNTAETGLDRALEIALELMSVSPLLRLPLSTQCLSGEEVPGTLALSWRVFCKDSW